MVAGPEVSRLIDQYQSLCQTKDALQSTKHHEETKAAQASFLQGTAKLLRTFQDLGNPFLEDSKDLLVLHCKDIADPTRAKLVAGHLQKGQEQFLLFMESVKQNGDALYHPIKSNVMDFFVSNAETVPAKKKC